MTPPADGDRPRSPVSVRLDPRNVWRIGWVVIALVAVALFVKFVIEDGGGVMFTVLMAWFASIAMEPAVARLATRMKRGLATGVVIAFFVAFSYAFGALFIDQIAELVGQIPALIDGMLRWVNSKLGSSYQVDDILSTFNMTPSQIANYSTQILGGLLGILGSVLSSVFSLFTFGLFTFYLSADGPRLRRYVASLFPPRSQTVAMQVWDTTAEKTGQYVAARVILAAINGGSSAIVFLLIGMPSWLALAVWTGVVAQFVPTIGTYIAIALPVLVGLLSPNPWVGVMALAWAVLYQQVENLTFEPRISARAVNVHPAVGFASVMFGAALFGVAGALLAIPVTAMIIALAESNRTSYVVVVPDATGTH